MLLLEGKDAMPKLETPSDIVELIEATMADCVEEVMLMSGGAIELVVFAT